MGGTSQTSSGKRAKSKTLGADEKTILHESAHFPDRDQVFGVSHKQYPAPDPSVSEWEGDHEEQVKGERDFAHDAVDELEAVPTMVEHFKDRQTAASTPTTVFPAEDEHPFEELTDEDLAQHAQAMGIAGREQMNRVELINALKEAVRHV